MGKGLRASIVALGLAAALAAPGALGDESRIVRWNAWSRQFIDPTVFEPLALPGRSR